MKNKIIEKIKINEKICRKNLTGIKWITKNPGRQWTASINPVFEDPREWYVKHYIPLLVGLEKVVSLCSKNNIPDDIFNMILYKVYESYANDAWKYLIISGIRKIMLT